MENKCERSIADRDMITNDQEVAFDWVESELIEKI